jgi:hypothetical protein
LGNGARHRRRRTPLEALSGSNGLAACADTVIVLDRDQYGKTLYVRGRDIEEKETVVTGVFGAITIAGNKSDVRRSEERNVILSTLTDHNEPMTPSQLMAATGRPGPNIRQLLAKMAKNEEIYKVGRGRYWIKPTFLETPNNNDHKITTAQP